MEDIKKIKLKDEQQVENNGSAVKNPKRLKPGGGGDSGSGSGSGSGNDYTYTEPMTFSEGISLSFTREPYSWSGSGTASANFDVTKNSNNEIISAELRSTTFSLVITENSRTFIDETDHLETIITSYGGNISAGGIDPLNNCGLLEETVQYTFAGQTKKIHHDGPDEITPYSEQKNIKFGMHIVVDAITGAPRLDDAYVIMFS